MKIAHVTTSDGLCKMAYCGAYAEGLTIIPNWKEMPPGHRACLRCVRKLNRLRINAKVPAYMIPRSHP